MFPNNSTRKLLKLNYINNKFSFQGAEISNIPVMLVGNKFDESAELKEVTHTEGQAEAAAWGVIIN